LNIIVNIITVIKRVHNFWCFTGIILIPLEQVLYRLLV